MLYSDLDEGAVTTGVVLVRCLLSRRSREERCDRCRGTVAPGGDARANATRSRDDHGGGLFVRPGIHVGLMVIISQSTSLDATKIWACYQMSSFDTGPYHEETHKARDDRRRSQVADAPVPCRRRRLLFIGRGGLAHRAERCRGVVELDSRRRGRRQDAVPDAQCSPS